MTSPAAAASDVPLRRPGVHTRSGNAMARTRGNLLDAAAHCVERYGVRRTTMGDIALKAVVAKATLYNHFRTKDDVLTALVTARATALAQVCLAVARGEPVPGPPGLVPPDLGTGLAAALRTAAAGLASDGPLRRVVADDPGLAARMAAPGGTRAWDAVRALVAEVLEAAGAPSDPPAVAVVVRWLASQVLAPADDAEAVLAAELLAAGLTDRVPVPTLEQAPEPVSGPAPEPVSGPSPAGAGSGRAGHLTD